MSTIAPVIAGTPTYGESNGVAQATLTIAKPAGVQTGDILVMAARCGSSAQTTDYVLAGWTRRGTLAFTASSATVRVTGLFTHYVTDQSVEPASYVFALAGNAFARQAGMIFIVRTGAGGTAWGAEPTYTWTGGFTGGPPMSITAFKDPTNSLVLYAAGNETVSAGATAGGTNPSGGLTRVGVRGSMTDQNDTTVTRSVIDVWSEVSVGATAAGAGKTVAFPSYSSQALSALSIPGTPPTTLPSRFTSVSQMLATKGATAAHRGGSAAYAEMVKDSYQKASARGFSVFEFSCGWSSDLVPFGLGQQYLDTTALNAGTTTLDPTAMSWATISGTYQNIVGANAPRPYYRLIDFLDDFTPLGVCLVDPKFGFATGAKITALLNICDAHGGPTKIIIKFDSATTDTQLTDAAHARGYVTMNYWSADTASMATQQSSWDLIGAAYAGGGALWAQAKSYGKKTWAAVIPDNASYLTAIAADDADLYMLQDTDGSTPVGPSVLPTTGSTTAFAYYSILSGMTKSSLADMELAYFSAQTGLSKVSRRDARRTFFMPNGERAQMISDLGLATNTPLSNSDLRRLWWAR